MTTAASRALRNEGCSLHCRRAAKAQRPERVNDTVAWDYVDDSRCAGVASCRASHDSSRPASAPAASSRDASWPTAALVHLATRTSPGPCNLFPHVRDHRRRSVRAAVQHHHERRRHVHWQQPGARRRNQSERRRHARLHRHLHHDRHQPAGQRSRAIDCAAVPVRHHQRLAPERIASGAAPAAGIARAPGRAGVGRHVRRQYRRGQRQRLHRRRDPLHHAVGRIRRRARSATAKTTGTVAGTGTCNGCFYVRSADVTALVSVAGPGTYAAGRVPATQGTTDNSNPAAGWTLAVVYEDFTQPIRSLSLFQGLEKSGGAAAAVSGFCTPPSGRSPAASQ